MISFFKYTNGEAFTLSGSNYTGYFNVLSGVAYTGKTRTSSSNILSAQNNFYSKCYLNQVNFDRTASYALSTNYQSIFALDLLDYNSLSRVFDTLDTNNMRIFAAIANKNANIFNLQSLTRDNHAHFYCLTSTQINSPQLEDKITGKRVYTSADPFSQSQDWQFLDNATSGAFLLDSSNNFTYFLGTSAGAYAVDGNFSFNSPLSANTKIIERLGLIADTEYNFVVDENTKQFYVVSPTTANVYDISSWDDCGSLIKVDSLSITIAGKEFASPNYFAVGNNYRISLYRSAQDEIIVHNKYTNELFYTIVANDIGLDSITQFDIRDEDDSVLVLGKAGESYYIKLLDISTDINVVSTHEFNPISTNKRPSINRDYKIKFAPFDSNAFIVYNGADAQLRYISVPEKPVVGLTRTGLLYLDDYIWDTTCERFDKLKIKFDCNAALSNYPNILNVSFYGVDSGIKMILHAIGRVYCIDITNIFEVSELNIPLSYSGLGYCSKSSAIFVINSLLQGILNDTYNLYNSIGAIEKLYPQDLTELTQTYIGATDIVTPKAEDLFLHENEDINTATLQRVILNIHNIQDNIANMLSTK